jgi:predicted enzyme related to lactoylglutathione lyase
MMKRSLTGIVIIIGIGFIACTNQGNPHEQTQQVCNATNKTSDMKNVISIVEIPTTNFSRAIAFYQAILNISIEEVDMDGVKMGLFPNDGEGVFVQLINGSGYKPSSDGAIVYLNGGENLQTVANKIEENGGKVIVRKSEIGPEMGFYAIFTDTEGNKLGLHSNS